MDFGYGMSAVVLLVGFVLCSFGVDWACHVFDRRRVPSSETRRPAAGVPRLASPSPRSLVTGASSSLSEAA